MTITPDDIKLLASARMTDADDGGGPMTSTALQDGVENNVFPDITSIDRAWGRIALRKVYPAVLSTGTDALMGANVIVADEPDEPNVLTYLFAASIGDSHLSAIQRLEQSHWEPLGPGGSGPSLVWDFAAYSSEGVLCLRGSLAANIAPGSVIYTVTAASTYENPVLVLTAVDGVTSGTTGGKVVTVHGEVALVSPYYAKLGVPSNATPRMAGTAAVVGTITAGATTCAVDSVLTPVAPVPLGSEPGPSNMLGIEAGAIPAGARAALLRGGDAVVIHHTASTSPATATNGGTVNCGRTGLARAVVVGSDGKTVTTGSYSVNRATGVVTTTDVTGWLQPVTVKHTIEDVLGLQRTGLPEIRQTASATAETVTRGPFALSAQVTMYSGRPNVGRIKVYSRTGQDITDLSYAQSNGTGDIIVSRYFVLDLTAGTAAFNLLPASPLLSTFIASHSPVTLVASGTGTDTTVTPTQPQANPNQLTFNRGVSRDFPAGSFVSSVLLLGDLQAQTGAVWSQATWTDEWADTRIGSAIAAQFNQAGYPIVVDNRGAVTERWAVIFTTSTTFKLVGETLGQIATGDINTPFAPANPATGQPYFTVPLLGWGTGWSAGNVLRLNTHGANAPMWAARIVMPSPPSDTPDSLTLAIRGDIDA